MSSNDPPTLMNIPLEVRHHIFKHVARRDVKPDKLLRYWFEKEEVKKKTAEVLARNPDVGTPRVVYEGDRFESEGWEEESEEEADAEWDSDEEEDEEEEDEEEEDDEEEEEDEETDEDEAEDQDEEMIHNDNTAAPAAPTQAPDPADTASEQATVHGQQQPAAASDQIATPSNAKQSHPASDCDLSAAIVHATAAAAAAIDVSTAAALQNTSIAPQSSQQDGGKDADIDTEMTEGDEANGGAEDSAVEQEDTGMDDDEGEYGESGDDEDADGDIDEDMDGNDDDQDSAAASVQPPPAPVVTAHSKWRHIPKFMRITHCPPPVELFLASKRLNIEAKDWFYNVAVLHVDATGSFAHTSFFEEALSQITEAAFSPMEDIRKVEVTFVWDSTWLRSDRADCAAAIFPALLRQRAIFVTNILAQAPNLSDITIHWHDSAEDEETVDLMNDILMGFLNLGAAVKVESHYIATDAKPHKNSIAGKQRIEFGRIVNNGLDRLF